MTWRAGYSDGSGPEHIVDRSTGKPVAALRWGCGCCQDRDPLTAEEIKRGRLIAQAPAMLSDLRKIATGNPPKGVTFKQWVRTMADRHLRAVHAGVVAAPPILPPATTTNKAKDK